MKTNAEFKKTGLTVLDLLLVAFIVLKLCGVINWPWVVVLWPLWVQLGILVIILIVFLIVVIVNKIRQR